MTVNWLMIEIRNPAGEVTYRNSFITDLPVDRDNVVELAACGRARWKIENESFNTLKTKGYNLEHNFGHGQHHLSAVLAILNLTAFAFHTVAELLVALWRNPSRRPLLRAVQEIPEASRGRPVRNVSCAVGNERSKPSDLILRRPRSLRDRLEGWPRARSRLWPSFETRASFAKRSGARSS